LNRHHFTDAGKLVAVWAAWFVSVPWGPLAQFLSVVFTLLLIAEKLGLLKHLTAWGNRVWQRIKARWNRE
jgi:hypothetical protein